MKKRVYIESSVVSYLTAKTPKEIVKQSKQICTQIWWVGRANYEIFISKAVLDEIQRGDPFAAALRIEAVEDIPLLEILPQTRELIDALVEEKAVPKKCEEDATHIALAALHQMDYLLTWNQSHIANAAMRDKINGIVSRFTPFVPIILTPEQLLESEGCLNHEID